MATILNSALALGLAPLDVLFLNYASAIVLLTGLGAGLALRS